MLQTHHDNISLPRVASMYLMAGEKFNSPSAAKLSARGEKYQLQDDPQHAVVIGLGRKKEYLQDMIFILKKEKNK